jgi:OOP family OmpA-OmpF porin
MIIFSLLFILIFLPSSKVIAQEGLVNKPGAITISPMFGNFEFDSDLCLDEDDFPSLFTYGLGYNINENWTAEILLGYTYPYHADSNKDIDVYRWGLDLLYHVIPESILSPYLVVGLGGLTYDPEGSSTETRALMNVGIGVKWFLNDTFALRTDVRDILAFDSLNDTENHWSYTFGLTMSFEEK